MLRYLHAGLALTGLLARTAEAAPHASQASEEGTYDYIVVGSGPGGGMTASNLAQAGHSVILIEAGADESATPNTYVSSLGLPGLPKLTWQFFARHYTDDAQELRNNWLTWRWPNGTAWVGNGKNAPKEVKLLGNYFPRGNTLGGSAMINAMASLLPNDETWDQIARIVGDSTWGFKSMREVFKIVERNQYLPRDTPGHGFDGVMSTWIYRSSFYEKTPARLATLRTIAQDAGQDGDKILSLLESDPNFVAINNKVNGIFGLPMHMSSSHRRWTPRDVLLATAQASNADGSKRHKLVLQLQSLATKILFDEKNGTKPRAIGVEFLEGAGIYKATAGYDATKAPKGVTKRVYAKREVIISGGTFNSPQLLQLSGVGDKAHLTSLGIKVIAHLPGVGQHLMDNQELPVVGQGQVSFAVPLDPAAANCTRGAPGDPCVEQWREGKGWYAMPQSNSEANYITTKHSPDGNRDMLSYAGNTAIRAFYLADPSQGLPPDPPTTIHRTMLRMNVQNDGGYVRINSTDPTDMPEINFRYFSKGSDSDIGAMVDFVAWNRRVFAQVPAPYGPVKTVEPPCPAGYGADGYCADVKQDEQWIRDNTFGHHPVGTCKIGADDDPMAVLDGRFRVRGVDGLRVVDASAWPIQPGAFPVMPTVLLGQKGSMVILEDAKRA